MATLRPHSLTTLAVWMTCIIVLFPGNAHAKDQVPDDTVWTPPSATFFYGQPNANITCKFVGTPYGVYWLKGSSAVTAETLVSRTGGKVSGPKHVDGSLTITEDYSLVFSNIQAQDAGNYICRVSNHHGFLIVNNTEVRVLDPAQVSIFTEPSVTGWVDDSVSLQCTFIGTPERVLWNRVQADPKSKSVETVLRYISGGYEVLGDRRYSWSDSYGLIIRDLQVLDEGNFTCMVSKKDGTEIKSTTVLTVHARAEKPYIQISECQSQPEKVTNGTAPKPCLYNVTDDKDMFQLQCSVVRTKPPVDILWQEGSSNVTASPIVSQRSDGAFDVTATITRRTNESTFTLTCIASGMAVDGNAERTVVVKVNKVAASSSSGMAVVVTVVVIIIITVVLFVIFFIMRVKMYQRHYFSSASPVNEGNTYAAVDPEGNPGIGTKFPFKTIMTKDCFRYVFFLKEADGGKSEVEQPLNKPTELEILREKVRNFEPGKGGILGGIEPPPVIHIGLFGIMGVGKSSFINSMNYALKGEYNNIAVEAETVEGGSRTKFREAVYLTGHIDIMDNRGMTDYQPKYIKDHFLPQISGKRGLDSKKTKKGKVVHCPVFVWSARQPTAKDTMLKFLSKFSSAVYDHYGRHVMVVVTHKEDVDDVQSQINEINLNAAVPKDYIWAFENYTNANHQHDEARSIKYLKFLQQCLDIGERNIKFHSERMSEKK